MLPRSLPVGVAVPAGAGLMESGARGSAVALGVALVVGLVVGFVVDAVDGRRVK